ncbi:MAG TPA: ketopantoate reductase family protein [Lacisediminihabitans sp.]|uniref:ketopantoate reductase family protein n=1 Tax=Lacisediminihabitans sp. TaxID=2787631 RepID=UPI002EDB49DD
MAPLKTLIVGAGAVGGYFGGRLAQAGRDVSFLIRPGRASVLETHGLVVRTPGGDFSVRPRVVLSGELDEPFELVVLATKAYGLEAALADVAPAIGPHTTVLPLLNGMRHLDVLRDRFGTERVVGGLCVIVSQLDPDGAVHQLADGASVSYGELDGSMSDRIRAVDDTFRGAVDGARLSGDILQAMWEKWVVLAAGGALTCLLGGSIGQIVAVPGGEEIARTIIHECSSVAEAEGFAPSARSVEQTTARLTQQGSSFTTSMFRDAASGSPVEVEQILGDLVARGDRHGVDVPTLRLATARLRIYQASLG